LSLWDENYRYGDLDAIASSFAAFGFNSALRVWHGGVVVAGNQSLKTLRRMRDSGTPPPHGVTLGDDGDWLIRTIDVSHLEEARAKAFAVADNRTQELGRNDEERLAKLLVEVAGADAEMFAATGYTDEDLKGLLAEAAEATEDRGPEPENKGSLLEIANVTIAEPKTKTEPGQVWQLGKHYLYVGRIFTDWPIYVPILKEGAMFVPLPNPLVVFSDRYDDTPLVMVHPNPYVAGHLIDRHRERYGDDDARVL
jgi:hypothetical protein